MQTNVIEYPPLLGGLCYVTLTCYLKRADILPLNQEYSMKYLIPQLLKRAGISIAWNCSANRKLHCKTFHLSFYENSRKKNGYCALNLNGHIIQVQNKVTETILDSFFFKEKLQWKTSQKYDAISNPYREKKSLNTLLQTCNLEAHIPHGRFSGYNWYWHLLLFINTLRNYAIKVLFIFQVLR